MLPPLCLITLAIVFTMLVALRGARRGARPRDPRSAPRPRAPSQGNGYTRLSFAVRTPAGEVRSSMNGRSRGVDRHAESPSPCAQGPPRAGTPPEHSSVRLVLF